MEEAEEEGLPDPVLRIGARCSKEHRGGLGVVTAGPLGKGEPPFRVYPITCVRTLVFS